MASNSWTAATCAFVLSLLSSRRSRAVKPASTEHSPLRDACKVANRAWTRRHQGKERDFAVELVGAMAVDHAPVSKLIGDVRGLGDGSGIPQVAAIGRVGHLQFDKAGSQLLDMIDRSRGWRAFGAQLIQLAKDRFLFFGQVGFEMDVVILKPMHGLL